MVRKVNDSECEWTEVTEGETRFRRKQLGAAADAEQLGASLYELPAGNRSWPYHYHTANEEAIYVLAGSGTLRAADGEHPLEAGDFVALPTGEDGAHRVVNTGEEPLRYLCVSTMQEPDVTVYPDSEKIGVFAGSPPGGESGERTVAGYYPSEAAVDYWEGEER
ncbi:cupin domain-containing protein [Haloarchaeobius amylolyticus]|uniref:cupin domain-containing protein n=1 Tax=Haloarchaeobius amylolyticus TaxID=1198296 RepID=UPI00226FD99F|nr:cupin domain-containing protein [Haloarchaeobius amylolyticus]